MKPVPVGELTGSPKILIYGKPGVGKTVLAAQAPRPTLLLDFDYGAKKGLARKLRQLGVDVNGLDVVREPDLGELEGLAQRLATSRSNFRYRSVVLDSLTELQQWHRTLSLGSRLRATRDDYGLNIEWVRRVVRNLCHSDLTVVFTCLQDEQEAEDGMWIAPALTPSLLRSVEALVDSIIHLSSRVTTDREGVVTVERTALSANMEHIRAKDRDGVLPTICRDPFWTNLFGGLYEPEPALAPEAAGPKLIAEDDSNDYQPVSEPAVSAEASQEE